MRAEYVTSDQFRTLIEGKMWLPPISQTQDPTLRRRGTKMRYFILLFLSFFMISCGHKVMTMDSYQEVSVGTTGKQTYRRKKEKP